jgi:hypothetical protein
MWLHRSEFKYYPLPIFGKGVGGWVLKGVKSIIKEAVPLFWNSLMREMKIDKITKNVNSYIPHR